MDNPRIHPLLKQIASLFTCRGKQVYLVGGAVRDLFMGREVHDWDLATDAAPGETAGMFRKAGALVIPTGIKHGTVTVHYRGLAAEITTFRTESDYRDGRRPEKTCFVSSVEEDLARRDFTMNAAAMRLPGGEIRDPFGGAEDIKKRLIRCVGDPAERFAEDGLRPLRAVRFAARLGFTVDRAALDAIPGALEVCAKVSAERIRDELEKILAPVEGPLPEGGLPGLNTGARRPSTAFRLMEETGLLRLILPELARCRGVEQKGLHSFDVLDHLLLACDYAAAEGFPGEVILAALLHDAGKPGTARPGGKKEWTFYGHEIESSGLARHILLRLRWPNAVIDTVCRLIEGHMFSYDESWTDAAVRRFVMRSGEENLENLYRLRRADAYAVSGTEPPAAFLLPLASRVDRVLSGGRVFGLKDLAVSGRDLIGIGIQPGKSMGIILGELLETVVDDPAFNTRDRLLETAAALAKRRASTEEDRRKGP